MSHPLDGAREKLKRAYEQIGNLDAELTTFIDSAGYTAYRKDYPYGYIGGVSGPTLPLRFSVLVGEIVHHLRSSLDHVVYQLAVTLGKAAPESTSREFPILLHKPIAAKQKARYEGKVQGVPVGPGSPEALIESLQPYNRPAPDDEPLSVLHHLNIVDKHRLLVTAGAMAKFNSKVGIFKFSSKDETPTNAINEQMKMGVDFSIRVVLKDAGVFKEEPVVPLLRQLATEIDLIVDSFTKFFP